jgi:hypothetical protein
MDIVADPRVIAHVPQDHRHVTPQELKNIPAYNVIMDKLNTTIMDYAMDQPDRFIKSTSRWTELHIVAFRCLFLENLPISRILPQADLPDDSDPTMKLIIQHLSDSEDEIRSGRSAISLGPATTFYIQLQVVLRSRRPGTPPSPITYNSSYYSSFLLDSRLPDNSRVFDKLRLVLQTLSWILATRRSSTRCPYASKKQYGHHGQTPPTT